jgi:uncharacterized protein
MSTFRAGRFDRQQVGWPLRGFCPYEAVNSIIEIDLKTLAGRGKKLILIDVDNTLLPWRSEDIPEFTIEWIKTARDFGFEVCILSNTRHRDRLKRLAEKMRIDFLLGRFKPSRRMYLMALEKYGRKPEQAIMIGDQLVTDILGANRAGIEAIWVKQMTNRDFAPTKVNRLFERVARPFFYRTLPVETVLEDKVAAAAGTGFLQRPIVRQFIKFGIVGGTSTIIDLGLHYTLMFIVQSDGRNLSETLGRWLQQNYRAVFGMFDSPSDAAYPILKVLSASVAILNGFYWNRRWTFKIRGKEERHQQLVKFTIVALTGLALNTLISSGLNNIIEGHQKRSWLVASIIATIVVAFWNFTGQRLWTFRNKKP